MLQEIAEKQAQTDEKIMKIGHALMQVHGDQFDLELEDNQDATRAGRKRLKERLKEELMRDEGKRTNTGPGEADQILRPWKERIFGICPPDGRRGTQGSK